MTTLETFAPMAPFVLHDTDGTMRGVGLGARTVAARGAALDLLLTNAAPGQKIVANQSAAYSVDVPAGVALTAMPWAVLTNTSTIPAIAADELDTSNIVLHRARDVRYYCAEPWAQLLVDRFETSSRYGQAAISANPPTAQIVVADGLLSWSSPGGGAYGATYFYSKKLPISQVTFRLKFKKHDPVAATYNDVYFGCASEVNGQPDQVNKAFVAKWRRTAAAPDGLVELNGDGSFTQTSLANAPLAEDCELILIFNTNSMTLAVDEGGRRRTLCEHDISIDTDNGGYDFEDANFINTLHPIIGFGTDAAGTTDTQIEYLIMCLNGSFGEREHVLVTYENGQPFRDERGRYLLTIDNCGPTQAQVSTSTPLSGYMKNQTTIRAYNADTFTFEDVGKISVLKNGKLFGAQETKLIFDRDDGKWHFGLSIWNEQSDGICQAHVATSHDPRYTLSIIPVTSADLIDFSGLGAAYTNTGLGMYGGEWVKIDGELYWTAIVRNDGLGRALFVGKCTAGDYGVVDELVFQRDKNAHLDEGSYFWRYGGNYYASCAEGNTIRVLALFTNGGVHAGDVVMSLTLPGSGGYPQYGVLLAHTKVGRTQLQLITFDDTHHTVNGVNLTGNFHVDSLNSDFIVGFGSTIILQVWEGAGEEFTPQPKWY